MNDTWSSTVGWESERFASALRFCQSLQLRQNRHRTNSAQSHTTAAESPSSRLTDCLKNTQFYEGLSQIKIFNKVCHGP